MLGIRLEKVAQRRMRALGQGAFLDDRRSTPDPHPTFAAAKVPQTEQR